MTMLRFQLCAMILLAGLVSVHASIPGYEYEALHEFYNATSGDDWMFGTNPGVAWEFSGLNAMLRCCAC